MISPALLYLRTHLHILDDLAGDIASQPLHCAGPDGLPSDAEEGDEEIGDGQVDDESIDRRLPTSEAVHLHQGGRVSDKGDEEHDAKDHSLHQTHLTRIKINK